MRRLITTCRICTGSAVGWPRASKYVNRGFRSLSFARSEVTRRTGMAPTKEQVEASPCYLKSSNLVPLGWLASGSGLTLKRMSWSV